MHTPKLVCFGMGYTAHYLAQQLLATGWQVVGTCRSAEKAQSLSAQGITPILFSDEHPVDDVAALMAGATLTPAGEMFLRRANATGALAALITGFALGLFRLGFRQFKNSCRGCR